MDKTSQSKTFLQQDKQLIELKNKFKKVYFGNSVLKNDVIHDAVKVICYKNFVLHGRSGDIVIW